MKNLRYLDLSSNYLLFVHTDAFRNSRELETLDFSNNNLSFNSLINRNLFYYCNNLSRLDLSDNNISILTSDMIINFFQVNGPICKPQTWVSF